MSDLRALHEAATPAPWTTGKGTKTIRNGDTSGYAIASTATRYHPLQAHEDANAALIVALRNAYASGDLVLRRDLERWVDAAYEADERLNAMREKVAELEDAAAEICIGYSHPRLAAVLSRYAASNV